MKVKEYREKSGYSQEELASKLNLKQPAYSLKEAGKRPFTVEEMLKLEILLGVSINEIYKEKKDQLIKELKDK